MNGLKIICKIFVVNSIWKVYLIYVIECSSYFIRCGYIFEYGKLILNIVFCMFCYCFWVGYIVFVKVFLY